MSKCIYCGCNEDHPVDGTAFFVNKNRTICASCAMVMEVKFENRITGVKAVIIAYKGVPSPFSNKEVRIKYGNDTIFEITLMDFLANYNEVKS